MLAITINKANLSHAFRGKGYTLNNLLLKCLSSGVGSTSNVTTTTSSTTATIGHSSVTSMGDFVKNSEELMFSGWRKVVRKNVSMPNGKQVSFDINYQGNPSVAVFNWDTTTKTCTLIREYHPGIEEIYYGTVAGIYEKGKKHPTALIAAQYELEEEAHLRTSDENWFPLLIDESMSTPMEKYSDNRLYCYLALNCHVVDHPKPMDDEEYIEIHRGITYKQLTDLLYSGKLNLPSSFTVMMGLKKLQDLGYPLE